MTVRRLIIWLSLPTVLLAACHRADSPVAQETEPTIGITVEFPEGAVPAKADVGEVPASDLENAIHDLKIWVFNSTTLELVAQMETDDLPVGGSVRKYALPVSRTFSINKPDVDVFVLANSASIASTLDASSTWGDLNAALFGTENGFFSPKTPVHSVPAAGLPMSGVGKGMKVSGEEPTLTIATVSVGRAVSKLRYVFCQTSTDDNSEEQVRIDNVVLSGYQIPKQEYVFSEEACRIVPGDYVPNSMETPWPAEVTLASSDKPEMYTYAGQDGPTYEKLITDAITAGELTDLGTTYLRESDKALTGTVYYTVTKEGIETSKAMPFSMDRPGDFARNHTWTLYGYFISNRTLQLGVSVLDWDKNNYTIKFNDESLQVIQKFTVDRSTADVVRIGDTNEYNVFLTPSRACHGYLYVATPQGGKLEVIPRGSPASLEAFVVTPTEATIDPTLNSGRIDILIDRNRDPEYTVDPTGCTITLEFTAFTPDGDREISGASECIDQIYHFYL